uniref:Uncharacterized protein n=1 Tax=Romanomermis culicivorax TaxID=13658 RepID=A0A915ICH7_ROMCU
MPIGVWSNPSAH